MEKQRRRIIRHFSQDGKQMKNSENRWDLINDIGEKEIILYGQIALEKHDYTVTNAERIRNSSIGFSRQLRNT